MKRLDPPAFNATQAIEVCASGISIHERAQALLDALPVIQASEAEYRELGPAGQLFQITESNIVTSQIDAVLMGVIYKAHFARKGSPSRALYEQIRMAPEYGICPLCAQRTVATVDHYLPQSRHPKLNLTPVNLVPACSDCNKNKLAGVPTRAEDQTLHPYFDDLGNDRWLVVEIQASSPPTISFAIRPAGAWNDVLIARVNYHFRVMGLGELYAAQAASEMADISYSLEDVGVSTGPVGVRQHLDGQFRSRYDRDANSWKTALYEGLRDSDWFCTEGYRMIRNRRP
ncbi:HNH endonuclease [Pseudomonas sp. NFPP07]|uniref:HNH endonuclease n=1 Tax=Pseudomonas sp. NFPP07 TaxID=1566213 RepID=UPI0008F13CA6|nr:HNH endonuclease [Pseudomonas sp. NFPP07]SFQ64503.1 HNH endonuclease [Pseudomonas sp. NFPP07]